MARSWMVVVAGCMVAPFLCWAVVGAVANSDWGAARAWSLLGLPQAVVMLLWLGVSRARADRHIALAIDIAMSAVVALAVALLFAPWVAELGCEWQTSVVADRCGDLRFGDEAFMVRLIAAVCGAVVVGPLSGRAFSYAARWYSPAWWQDGATAEAPLVGVSRRVVASTRLVAAALQIGISVGLSFAVLLGASVTFAGYHDEVSLLFQIPLVALSISLVGGIAFLFTGLAEMVFGRNTPWWVARYGSIAGLVGFPVCTAVAIWWLVHAAKPGPSSQ